jgi:hypothetical protein
MATATFQLTIKVKYELEGEPPEAMKAMLEEAASYLANRGLLSGDSPAYVDEWVAKVKQIGDQPLNDLSPTKEQPRQIVLSLNIFDEEGIVVDTARSALTVPQIEDIVDHASQLVLLSRDGEGTADVLAELEEALCASGVIDYRSV